MFILTIIVLRNGSQKYKIGVILELLFIIFGPFLQIIHVDEL